MSTAPSKLTLATTWPLLGAAMVGAALAARTILKGPVCTQDAGSGKPCGKAAAAKHCDKKKTCGGAGAGGSADTKHSDAKAAAACPVAAAQAAATAAATAAAAGHGTLVPAKRQAAGPVVVVPMTEADRAAAGEVCERAFDQFNYKQGMYAEFNPGLPALIFAGELQGQGTTSYVVVAKERGGSGRVIGSNAVDAADGIASIGPISVDPDVQAAGVGKQLMQAVIDWALAKGIKDIRLAQICDNHVSWALYTKLGFDSPLTFGDFRGCGKLLALAAPPGLLVRDMTAGDVDACDALLRDVTGQASRRHGIETAAHVGLARLVVVDTTKAGTGAGGGDSKAEGAIVGFTTSFRIDQFTVARHDAAVQALLIAYAQRWAKHEHGKAAFDTRPATSLDIVVHVPLRLYPSLVRWLLTDAGLTLARQCTTMTLRCPGAPAWRDPQNGLYLQSIGY